MGPSSWRRVQALRSTEDEGMPRRSTSSLKASSSSPPPLAPQRPSPGVAHTKIWQSLLTPRFYSPVGTNPIKASGFRLQVSIPQALSTYGLVSQGKASNSTIPVRIGAVREPPLQAYSFQKLVAVRPVSARSWIRLAIPVSFALSATASATAGATLSSKTEGMM